MFQLVAEEAALILLPFMDATHCSTASLRNNGDIQRVLSLASASLTKNHQGMHKRFHKPTQE